MIVALMLLLGGAHVQAQHYFNGAKMSGQSIQHLKPGISGTAWTANIPQGASFYGFGQCTGIGTNQGNGVIPSGSVHPPCPSKFRANCCSTLYGPCISAEFLRDFSLMPPAMRTLDNMILSCFEDAVLNNAIGFTMYCPNQDLQYQGCTCYINPRTGPMPPSGTHCKLDGSTAHCPAPSAYGVRNHVPGYSWQAVSTQMGIWANSIGTIGSVMEDERDSFCFTIDPNYVMPGGPSTCNGLKFRQCKKDGRCLATKLQRGQCGPNNKICNPIGSNNRKLKACLDIDCTYFTAKNPCNKQLTCKYHDGLKTCLPDTSVTKCSDVTGRGKKACRKAHTVFGQAAKCKYNKTTGACKA